MQRRIVHSCGHEQDHYVIAEYAADCDRQAIRLGRRKCNTCSVERAKTKSSQDNAALMELALVALQGSAKQIAWAETIRAKRLVVLQRQDSEAAKAIARVADAKWWIERRSVSDVVLVAAAAIYESL